MICTCYSHPVSLQAKNPRHGYPTCQSPSQEPQPWLPHLSVSEPRTSAMVTPPVSLRAKNFSHDYPTCQSPSQELQPWLPHLSVSKPRTSAMVTPPVSLRAKILSHGYPPVSLRAKNFSHGYPTCQSPSQKSKDWLTHLSASEPNTALLTNGVNPLPWARALIDFSVARASVAMGSNPILYASLVASGPAIRVCFV